MRSSEFNRLRTIEDGENIKDMEVGDRFLYGQRLISQKTNKKVGDPISYFEVIMVSEDGKRIEYAPIFDTLIKDKEVEN